MCWQCSVLCPLRVPVGQPQGTGALSAEPGLWSLAVPTQWSKVCSQHFPSSVYSFFLCNFIFQLNCFHFKFCTLAFCHLLELGCQHLALPVNVLVAGEKEERDQESCGKCCMNHMAVYLLAKDLLSVAHGSSLCLIHVLSNSFLFVCLFSKKEGLRCFCPLQIYFK